MRQFLIALQFLTILPIKIKKDVSQAEVATSMAFFPLVGITIAFLLSLLYLACVGFLPRQVACALLLIGWLILTGGLHLDGLADTIDGLSGNRDKTGTLEIMRDSRIGPMGTIALVGLLILKFSLLCAISKEAMLSALITSLAFGRWSMVLSSYLFPYARSRQGKASFIEFVGSREFAWSTATLVIFGIFSAGFKFFILLPLAIVVLAGFNLALLKKIGGVTGDTLGGLSEVIETLALFGFLTQ
jgi:adenosylcobinamide-GDP ribazoletransferase